MYIFLKVIQIRVIKTWRAKFKCFFFLINFRFGLLKCFITFITFQFVIFEDFLNIMVIETFY